MSFYGRRKNSVREWMSFTIWKICTRFSMVIDYECCLKILCKILSIFSEQNIQICKKSEPNLSMAFIIINFIVWNFVTLSELNIGWKHSTD